MTESTSSGCLSALRQTLLTYETVKIVRIQNTFIAVVFRLLQLVIFAYIALYIVWYKQGYQEFQEPRGTSIIKLKGIAKVNGTDAYQRQWQDGQIHLWDTAEYQIPALENNAFFLATRQIFTYNQHESVCPSAIDSDQNLECDPANNTCVKDSISPNTFGFLTGECVPSEQVPGKNVCQIAAWCPEELSNSIVYTLDDEYLRNFTIYLKTIVTFSLFSKTLRNVRDNTDFKCRYDADKYPNCPIITVGTILESLNTDEAQLLENGGVIEIRQDWTCNFDFDDSKCYPTLKFVVIQTGTEVPSPGINYRYAQKYRVNETDYRTLSKVFGLRFVVVITGKGGQFNIVNLFVAIGSGIGFMVIAGIVCDAIFMYFHRAREFYRQRKFSVYDADLKKAISEQNLNDGLPMQVRPLQTSSTA